MMMMQTNNTRTLPEANHDESTASLVMLSRLDAMLPTPQQSCSSSSLSKGGKTHDLDIQRDSGNSSDFSSSGDGTGVGRDDGPSSISSSSSRMACDSAIPPTRRRSAGVECLAGADGSFDDERTLANLVYLEDFYRVHSNYFVLTQTDIKPWMHKTLAGWMLEVCLSLIEIKIKNKQYLSI